MAGMLSLILVLAVIVLVVAALSEGRGRHLLRLALRLRPHATTDEILAPVPRGESDWDLVQAVDSTPDRPAPSARAAAWARETATHARESVVERAGSLRPSDEIAIDAPRTGELGLARQ